MYTHICLHSTGGDRGGGRKTVKDLFIVLQFLFAAEGKDEGWGQGLGF
jgi:hypothetical protein